ncbi:hypothetical protein [Oscillibacter sp.]|uniref:hypothetical protein n=1 Tax=Oscillibacter sp. TaxID=1945593 RepID=UPI0028AA5151|nr:hypothetical protein [Oscillibacter sp.]
MEIGSASGHRYHKFGTGKVDLVIEMGLGSALGEWWHVAEILSNKYTVLLYERLRSMTKPDLYDAAIEEYCLAHTERCVLPLRIKESFPQLPLVLVTHTSEYSIKEIMEFGRTTRVLAEKVEQIWQELMQKYLAFSKVSKLIRARDSGHYLHLSEPELINEALDWVSAQK